MQSMTLLTWTLQVWNDHKRGLPLQGHHAAIAESMEFHREWWNDWESARIGGGDERTITNRLIHIHNDAAIKTQVETGQPPEIKVFFANLTDKGFTIYECVHTIAVALSEENAFAREHNEMFSRERYVQLADRYCKEALARPNLTRLAKTKAY